MQFFFPFAPGYSGLVAVEEAICVVGGFFSCSSQQDINPLGSCFVNASGLHTPVSPIRPPKYDTSWAGCCRHRPNSLFYRDRARAFCKSCGRQMGNSDDNTPLPLPPFPTGPAPDPIPAPDPDPRILASAAPKTQGTAGAMAAPVLRPCGERPSSSRAAVQRLDLPRRWSSL